MLTFILGAPKSGKTEEMIKRIKNDLSEHRRVLLIVPEQEAIVTERRIISSYKGNDALFLLEIANFRRLPNIVFRQKGGVCYNYIDKGGQAVMMYRALKELSPELSTYRTGTSTDIGLVSGLVSLYSRFGDYNITPIRLEDSVVALPETLRARGEDIATLYTRYDELIHDGFDSAKDDLKRVADFIRNDKLFSDTRVYIDSFSGFTPAELDVIRALISSDADVTVSLCIDKDRDGEIFSNLYDIKNSLSSVAGDNFEEYFCENPKRSKEFEYFADCIFDSENKVSYEPETENITLLIAPDIYSECEIICADIAASVKKGMRYRDITVVAGNAEDYFGVLDVMMKRHKMPCRFMVSRDLLQSPCVKLLISALNIITYNWKLDDVIGYLKTGFSSLSDNECDIIEEYACAWELSGSVWTMEEEWSMNPSGYSQRKSKSDEKLLEQINSIRQRITAPIITLADSLKADRSVESSCKALYEFLTTAVDASTLKGEDIASWNAVIDALEQLSLCAGTQKLDNTDNLKKLIRLICSQISYSMLPASIDELNVVSIGTLRSVEAKKIYIIGANEGSYPCNFSEDNIIDDRMRAALTDTGLILPNDPTELYYEQNWLFYKTVLSAAESVVITRAAGTLEGKECVEAPALGDMKRIFPNLKERRYEDFAIDELIYDRVSAFDRISDEVYGETLRKILSADEGYRDAVSDHDLPVTTESCRIELPENLERLRGDIPLSQTKLESFVKCKFAYQLQYNLKLKEQTKIDYDGRDIGNFVHKILEEYLKRTVKPPEKGEKGRYVPLEAAEMKELVDSLVDEYINATCGSRSFVTKRLEALFEKIRRNALLFVKSISKELCDSDFIPVFYEMVIGKREDAVIPAVELELTDGSHAYINGMIDRVDICKGDDGKIYFRIIDYKTGNKDFKISNIDKGTDLQMFLYLFSIMKNKEKVLELTGCEEGELVPAATIYYKAKIKPETHGRLLTRDELEADVISRIERSGALLDDGKVIDAISNSHDMTVFPQKTDIAKRKGEFFTLDRLCEIENTINNIVKDIGDAIKRGDADAIPNENLKACEYCRMKCICRRIQKGDEDNE